MSAQGKRPGTLYVVATPIGNLSDLSPRAAEVLRSVRLVAAEDTRRTLKLFAHLGVTPPALKSLPAFDERARLAPVLKRLAAGENVALCTDAGTPGVSDPGAALVAAAWAAGARVVPIPGPSAALAALSASGFGADRFFFAGFLPRKGGARAEALRGLAAVGATIVLYEAGNRARATLADLRDALGDRDALVARELTKLHEELARGPLSALEERFAGEVLGEVTIVVGGREGEARRGRAQVQPDEAAPAPQGAPDDERGFAAGTDLELAGGSGGREGEARRGRAQVQPDEAAPELAGGSGGREGEARVPPRLEEELARRLAGGDPPSAIAREVARARGLRRADVYAAIERLKRR